MSSLEGLRRSTKLVAWLISDGSAPDTPLYEDGLVLGRSLARGWDQMKELGYRSLPFMELPNSMLSDLHCVLMVRPDSTISGHPVGRNPEVHMCNLSATSIWVNDNLMAPGQSVVLKDGDWICLTQQVGAAVDEEVDGIEFQFRAAWGSTTPTPPSASSSAASSSTIFDTGSVDTAVANPFASSHVRADNLQAVADLMLDNMPYCPVCCGLLNGAVQLQPCGHTFCATCLSHELGAQLQSSTIILSCPLGCASAQRIVVATRARARVNSFLLHGSLPARLHHTNEDHARALTPHPSQLPSMMNLAQIHGLSSLDSSLGEEQAGQSGEPHQPPAPHPSISPSPSVRQPVAPAVKEPPAGPPDPDLPLLDLILQWAYDLAILEEEASSPLSPAALNSNSSSSCSMGTAPASPQRALGAAQHSTISSLSLQTDDNGMGSSMELPGNEPAVTIVSGRVHVDLMGLPQHAWPAPVRVPGSGGVSRRESVQHRPYVDSPVFTSSPSTMGSPGAGIGHQSSDLDLPEWSLHYPVESAADEVNASAAQSSSSNSSSPATPACSTHVCVMSSYQLAHSVTTYTASLPSDHISEVEYSSENYSSLQCGELTDGRYRSVCDLTRSPAGSPGGWSDSAATRYLGPAGFSPGPACYDLPVTGSPEAPSAAPTRCYTPVEAGCGSFTGSPLRSAHSPWPPRGVFSLGYGQPSGTGHDTYEVNSAGWARHALDRHPLGSAVTVSGAALQHSDEAGTKEQDSLEAVAQESGPCLSMMHGLAALAACRLSPDASRGRRPPIVRQHRRSVCLSDIGSPTSLLAANSMSRTRSLASSPLSPAAAAALAHSSSVPSDTRATPTVSMARNGSFPGPMSFNSSAVASCMASSASGASRGQSQTLSSLAGVQLSRVQSNAAALAAPAGLAGGARAAGHQPTELHNAASWTATGAVHVGVGAGGPRPSLQSRWLDRLQAANTASSRDALSPAASLQSCDTHVMPGTASPSSPHNMTRYAGHTPRFDRGRAAWRDSPMGSDVLTRHAGHTPRNEHTRQGAGGSALSQPLLTSSPRWAAIQRMQMPRRCISPRANSDARDVRVRQHLEELKLLMSSEQDACTPSGGSGSSQFKSPASMHVLFALHDFRLPLDLVGWRGALVDRILLQLRLAAGPSPPSSSTSPPSLVHTLEMMARLAWASADVKEGFAGAGAIPKLISIMRTFSSSAAVQAAACMAMAGLVVGTGDVCLTNQWDIAKAMGVEALEAAIKAHPQLALLQLAALMAFIPLAVNNPMMQANICKGALPTILASLDQHQRMAAVQAKGMVLLGVLVQGEEPLLDAVRTCLIEAQAHQYLMTALRVHGKTSDAVLWPCLFAASMLTADGRVQQSVSVLARKPGLVACIRQCLEGHVKRANEARVREDKLVMTTGLKLVALLEEEQVRQRRVLLYLGGSLAACAAVTGALCLRYGVSSSRGGATSA